MIDERTGIEGIVARHVAALPDRIEGAVAVGPYSSARPGLLLRVVPGTGRFLARDGTSLEYWLEEGADPAAGEALLQGGILGALIHQRGELPLHATTLVAPGGAFALALAGASGAGKSTTAFALVRRGWTMLSDDLTRVTVDGGQPAAWPGRARLRLLADACDRFGIDARALRPAPNWPGKYLVDMTRWERPAPLAAMVVIDRSEGPLRAGRQRGGTAMRALADQTYRPHYIAALGCAQRHFELVAATAGYAKIFEVTGCGGPESIAEWTEATVLAGVDVADAAWKAGNAKTCVE